MATITGIYDTLTETLLGTSADDLFIAGRGTEYLFGDTGDDAVMVSLHTDDVLAFTYYPGFEFGLLVSEASRYSRYDYQITFLRSIETVEFENKTIDLKLIESDYGGWDDYPTLDVTSGIYDTLSETFTSDLYGMTFLPGRGDATIIGSGTVNDQTVVLEDFIDDASINNGRLTIEGEYGYYIIKDTSVVIGLNGMWYNNQDTGWEQITSGFIDALNHNTELNIDDYGNTASDCGNIDINTTTSGEIETPGDYDWLAVELVSGSSYEFTAEGNSLDDPFLALIDTDGNLITYNDDTENSLNSQIIFEAVNSGTYYLEVSDASDDNTGSYLLNATLLDDGTDKLLDANNDGFVDQITNYQMWTASGGVDLTNRRGRTYSDESSRMWDAIKAVETTSGFSVLVEGQRNKEGKYKVATANDEGVIDGATRWLNGNQMYNEGYEELFIMDFNGNSDIGF